MAKHPKCKSTGGFNRPDVWLCICCRIKKQQRTGQVLDDVVGAVDPGDCDDFEEGEEEEIPGGRRRVEQREGVDAAAAREDHAQREHGGRQRRHQRRLVPARRRELIDGGGCDSNLNPYNRCSSYACLKMPIFIGSGSFLSNWSNERSPWSETALTTVSNAPKMHPSAREMSMAKKRADQRLEAVILVRTSGYTMKARPGPPRST